MPRFFYGIFGTILVQKIAQGGAKIVQGGAKIAKKGTKIFARFARIFFALRTNFFCTFFENFLYLFCNFYVPKKSRPPLKKILNPPLAKTNGEIKNSENVGVLHMCLD